MSVKEPPSDFSARNFFNLTPDRILDAVEGALGSESTGIRATGRAFALNSIENRVYEIELDNEQSVVAKFYRPRRWTSEQILEEHDFIARLKNAEIPVCPPLNLVGSPKSQLVWDSPSEKTSTLALSEDGILFTVFPKVRGRILDELQSDQLEVLGRYVARLHAVGAGMKSSKRRTLDVEGYGWNSLELLEESGHLDSNLGHRYSLVIEELLERIEAFFDGVPMQRVHGDCHLGNVLWSHEGPFFVDFDDMIVAPPVQDIWMIVRGDDEIARKQRDTLIGAYEEMRDFDHSTIDLIEPLRVLRMVHYSAWIAQRWEDPSFPRMFPTFGSDAWWLSEIEAFSRVSEALNG